MTQDEALNLCGAAADRDPITAVIGIRMGRQFFEDPLVFAWFSSTEEAAKYVSSVVMIALGAEADELPDEDYEADAAEWLKSKEGQQALIAHHNRLYRPLGGMIDWIGNFDDLAVGNGDLAKEIRRDFNEDESDAIISEASYKDFAEFLSSWSI